MRKVGFQRNPGVSTMKQVKIRSATDLPAWGTRLRLRRSWSGVPACTPPLSGSEC
jgi:hypothetical protein